MKKMGLVTLLVIALSLIVASLASADFSVVSYGDTAAVGYEPGSGTTQYYISNGDFSLWENGYPVGWNVPTPATSNGWEVHLAQTDLALTADGMNYGMGWFFRAGTAGSQFATVSQQVSPELVSGYYWVELHETVWGQNIDSGYNAIAWYGFGTSDDPASVTDWRELDPFVYQCENFDGICIVLGRKETRWVNAGEYMFVKMGMKYPDHQSWSVFVIDDITVRDVDDSEGLKVWWIDGLIGWHPNAPR